MDFIKQGLKQISLSRVGKNMFIGAVIGLIVISSFVFTVNQPDPSWGAVWRIRPLILTPLITAFGMLAFLLKDFVSPNTRTKQILVFLFSMACFFISLWLGIILGLDGTLWN